MTQKVQYKKVDIDGEVSDLLVIQATDHRYPSHAIEVEMTLADASELRRLLEEKLASIPL